MELLHNICSRKKEKKMQPVVWNMAYGNYQKKTDLLLEKAASDMTVLLEINDRDWKAPECGVWKEHLNNHDHQYMEKSRSHQTDQFSLKKNSPAD